MSLLAISKFKLSKKFHRVPPLLNCQNWPIFQVKKSAAPLRGQHSFWSYASFLEVLDQELHSKYLLVTSRSPLARIGIPSVAVKSGFQAHFGGQIWKIKMLITQQIIVIATFQLHHRHQRFLLYKICHFHPFLKIKLSKKIFMGPPFAKMPKITHFSGLWNSAATLRRLHSFWSYATFLEVLD